MTRADDLGDNAALTPNDALGDVHATAQVPVRALMQWRSRLEYTQESNATLYEITRYIPTPRLVTVDLDEIKAAWENSGVDQGRAWEALVARLEKES